MGGIVCSGNLRAAYVDQDGVLTGAYIGLLNTQKLIITIPDPTVVQRLSKQNDSYGQALDQVSFPKPTEIEIAVDDAADKEVLGWATGGVPSDYTQAGGSITAEAHVAVPGQWFRLANRSVSALVVTSADGETTFVAGTDYIADLKAGFIKIIESGAIESGDALKAAYTAAALTGFSIAGGSRASIQVRLEGDLINLANNQPVHVVVPKAVLSASGGLDFMGSDFLVADMKGNAVVVTGQPAYTITSLSA